MNLEVPEDWRVLEPGSLGNLPIEDVIEWYDGPLAWHTTLLDGQKAVVYWVDECPKRQWCRYMIIPSTKEEFLASENVRSFLTKNDKTAFVTMGLGSDKVWPLHEVDTDAIPEDFYPDPKVKWIKHELC